MELRSFYRTNTTVSYCPIPCHALGSFLRVIHWPEASEYDGTDVELVGPAMQWSVQPPGGQPVQVCGVAVSTHDGAFVICHIDTLQPLSYRSPDIMVPWDAGTPYGPASWDAQP